MRSHMPDASEAAWGLDGREFEAALEAALQAVEKA